MTQSTTHSQENDGGSIPTDNLDSIDQPLVVIPRGGTREVGRSCYHVQTPDLDVLVDCGLNQGGGGQFPDFRGIDEGDIDAVFLTHAHIDHSGGLPVLEYRSLLADDAPVITTRPTTALAHTLLHDSIKIHEEEIEHQGRDRQFTRDNVHDALERFAPQRYGKHELSEELRRVDTLEDITYELGGAGHLLGSAWLAIEYRGRRVVFSGDLGGRSAHLPDIETPPPADTLFLESTYGDRQQHRSLKKARNQLYQETLNAVKNGIPVLIPTFAVGRAQEIMQVFRERFPHEPEEIQEQLEVVYDGMARDATAAYHAFSIGEFVNEKINNWRVNAQDNEPFLPDCAWYPEDNSEREPILDGENAPIIVAPSGMLTGGTSPLYLTALVERYDEARIFFTGYQAEGTPGRVLQGSSESYIDVSLSVTPFTNSSFESDSDGETTVTVPNEWIDTISGFSGHCARQVLYEFAEDVDAKHVALIHGPSDAQIECRGYLRNKINADVVTRASMGTPIPIYGESTGELTDVDESVGAANAITVRPSSEVDTSHITDELVDDEYRDNNENEEDDSDTTPDLDLEERIEKLEDRNNELESELAAVRHNERWSEKEIRQLVRDEINNDSASSGSRDNLEPDRDPTESINTLSEVAGVGPGIIQRLKKNGYSTLEDLQQASITELCALDQIGESIANSIQDHAQNQDRSNS